MEEGRHNRYIEAAPTSDVLETMINSFGIELKTYNKMIIRQSLRDYFYKNERTFRSFKNRLDRSKYSPKWSKY